MKKLMMMAALCLALGARGADELKVEHAAAETLPGYKIGDRVTVADAAGERFVATLLGYDRATDVVRVQIDQEEHAFPAAHLQYKAGVFARLVTAYQEGHLPTYLWTGAAGLAAVFAPGLVDKVAVGSKDDEAKVSAAEAAAMAQAAADAAEQRVLTSGPSVAVQYVLGGTWTGPARQSGTGLWTPSITFGLPDYNAAGASGQVDSVRGAPGAPGGDPQVLLGGRWRQVGEREIHILWTSDVYAGRAFVNGFDGAYSLNINGAVFTGGTVTAIPRAVEP